jgi:hypothetical protein
MRTSPRRQAEKLGADPQTPLLGGAAADLKTNPIVIDEDAHTPSLIQE